MSRESNLKIRFSVLDSEKELVEQLSCVLNEWYSIDKIYTDGNGILIDVWNSEHYYLAEVMPGITRIIASIFPEKEIDAGGRGEYSVVDDIHKYRAGYDPKTKDIFASWDHYCRGTGEEDDTQYYGCRTGLTEDELEKMISVSKEMGYSQLFDRLKAVQCVPDSLANGSGWVNGFMECAELADENGFVILQGVLYDYIGTEEDLNLVIPEGVTTIGDPNATECTEWVAFANASFYMTSVTIPSSVTRICGRAFEGCNDLSSIIVVEDNNTFYSDGPAVYTKDKKSIIRIIPSLSEAFEIPSGVTDIGDYAFSCCLLTSVTIPDSVTSIGKHAFDCCYLTVNGSPESFAESYATENGIPFVAV